MSKLQRKIKTLEASMNADVRSMNQSWLVLARYTHSLPFVLTASIFTFIAGMALGYRRSLVKVTAELVYLSAKIYKWQSQAALLMSIIP